jgi:hypothetical protein
VSWALTTDYPEYPISEAEHEAIERAKRIGTYNQIDRKPQYSTPQHALPEQLLEAVNVQGNHIRGVRADVGRVQRQIYDLKLRNSIIVALVTATAGAALMEAPKIAGLLWSWFGW